MSSSILIRTPSGELLGFAKITRDLTEQRQAEKARRCSEDQFLLLVQSVTDYSLYMLDLKGHVTSWNLGAERIKGYLRGAEGTKRQRGNPPC